jgi:hypothetical protein
LLVQSKSILIGFFPSEIFGATVAIPDSMIPIILEVRKKPQLSSLTYFVFNYLKKKFLTRLPHALKH